MKRLLVPALTPAMIGVSVVRHFAWYLSYHAAGDERR